MVSELETKKQSKMAIFWVKIDSFEYPCHLTRFFRVFLRVGDIILYGLGPWYFKIIYDR